MRDVGCGSYRAGWIWLAEAADRRILACAVWWGFRADRHPLNLDCLNVDSEIADRVALGSALLKAGHAAFHSSGLPQAPEYHLLLKAGWRSDASASAEVEWRRKVAQSAGFTDEWERRRYEWTCAGGLEPPSGRLSFSPEPEDSVFIEAFQRVSAGSLDHETRRDIAAFGAEHQARSMFARLHAMPGDRSWWRIARLPDGRLVGFVVPSANDDNPVIAYLGVVPEMRGHGYGAELLAEATRILAANGAERIRADTDTTNFPMAAAFERVRYRNFGVRLIFSTTKNPAT